MSWLLSKKKLPLRGHGGVCLRLKGLNTSLLSTHMEKASRVGVWRKELKAKTLECTVNAVRQERNIT